MEQDSHEWFYLYHIEVLLRIVRHWDIYKFPINIPRLFREILQNWSFDSEPTVDTLEITNDVIFDFFKIPDSKFNLVQLSHFLTIFDFTQLQDQHLYNLEEKNYLGEFPLIYKDCITEIIENLKNSMQKDDIVEQNVEQVGYISPSPCLNISKSLICKDFCKDISNLLSGKKESVFSILDLLKIAKLSLPQRKLKVNEKTENISEIGRILYGDKNIGNLKSLVNLGPLIIFCKYKDNAKWKGDDIGMYAKFCDDFYHTPTQKGLCHTENLNLAQIFNLNENFVKSFETNNRDTSFKITSDFTNAMASFVIDTDYSNEVIRSFPKLASVFVKDGEREDYEEIKRIQMQIHSSNEIANMEYIRR